MQLFLETLLASGRKGFELAFFVLMPIMVFMMAFMRVLEGKGVLRAAAVYAAPVLVFFGLPGLGVFAILQILLVSFAAPVSTLRIIDQDADVSDRKLAATLAAILCMSQANATFPLAVVGLELQATMLSSLLGGLIASFLTYRYFGRHLADETEPRDEGQIAVGEGRRRVIDTLMVGAEEGFQLALKATPLLVLAVFAVNTLKNVGAIALVERVFAPVLALAGISGAAVLSIVTKYIAGGTAMMGATMPMIQDGTMSVAELNRIAGFTINTFDPVGIAVLASSGKRVAAFVVPAAKGALVGIVIRGAIHLAVF